MSGRPALDSTRNVQLWRPGRVEYERALAWQLDRAEALAGGREPESLHDPHPIAPRTWGGDKFTGLEVRLLSR